MVAGRGWPPLGACLAAALLVCTAASPPSSAALPAYRNFTGHHLIRVHPTHEGHVQLLKQLPGNEEDAEEGDEQVDFWRHPSRAGSPVDIRLPPGALRDTLDWIRKSGMQHEVLAADLQTLVDQQRERRSVEDSLPHSFNLSMYHTYAEISAWMDHVARECGAPCSILNIGLSFENRPLKVFKISLGAPDAPTVWIDAGIHAREWISPATAVYLIDKLVSATPDDPELYQTVRQFTWYIMPVANPDGYEYTWTGNRMWRKTRSVDPTSHFTRCQGADPNRNWGFHWAGYGTSPHPCSDNYRGQRPFSEPETAAMSRILLSIQPRPLVYISLHSYGQYWLTPWGYTYGVPTDYHDMYTMGRMATRAMRRSHGSHYLIGSSARLLYLAAGGSDDWAKGVAGVKYAYTVELRDTGRHGFLLPPDLIDGTGAEITGALRALTAGVMRQRQRALRRAA